MTVAGEFTREEIILAFEDWAKHDVTLFLLWDLRDAGLSSLNNLYLEQIAIYAKTYANLRKNGKTALLVPTDLSFGISRMYEAITAIREHPIPIRAFRYMEEAFTWLAD